jgi:hypothetical protein
MRYMPPSSYVTPQEMLRDSSSGRLAAPTMPSLADANPKDLMRFWQRPPVTESALFRSCGTSSGSSSAAVANPTLDTGGLGLLIRSTQARTLYQIRYAADDGMFDQAEAFIDGTPGRVAHLQPLRPGLELR